jgi:soluble lytic murein transglycosylase-like protein
MNPWRSLGGVVAIAGAAALFIARRAGAAELGGVMDDLPSWQIPTAGKPYAGYFDASERRHGLPKNLLARVAYQESRFRTDIITGKVKSSAGATGIMQLVPKFHRTVNPLDPPAAIDYAGSYLKQLQRQFGDWKLALAAYNAGPANVTKYKGVPPFAETQAYVREISADVRLA